MSAKDMRGPYRIALVTMPFAAVHLPSIALTQLRSVLETRFGDAVEVRLFYLNLDFVDYLGQKRYRQVSDSVNATVSGLGDWLFRGIAFPEAPDNREEYLKRYGHTLGAERELLDSPDASSARLDRFLDTLIDRHQLDRFDLVGFSSMFAQNVASFALAAKLKLRQPDLVTVVGGANCETAMGRVIARRVQAVDFVFSGPALKTFPEFVGLRMAGDDDACHALAGVYSLRKLEAGGETATDEIGAELGLEHPVPLDYTDFLAEVEAKSLGVEPSLLFETSRGCWWGERAHCTFCGLNGSTMSYRYMAPAQALSQFEALFSYWPRVTRFESVDNILPRQYLKDVLPQLARPDNTRIFYEIKADLKDHEMQVLAEAGVTELQPGIEALASSTLKLMRKGTTAFHNIRFLKLCLVHGIDPVWNLLVGFPGELEEVYAKYVDVLPALTHLPPPNGCFPVRFDRYSPYYTGADSYGLELRPLEFYALVYPFPERDLADLAYFFADANYANEYIAITAKWLKPLEQATQTWNERWRGDASTPRLELEWRGERQVVCDSRSGALVEHDLDATGVEILSALERPLNRKRLERSLEHIDASRIGERLDQLYEADMVFEEDGQFMSLVIDSNIEQGYL